MLPTRGGRYPLIPPKLVPSYPAANNGTGRAALEPADSEPQDRPRSRADAVEGQIAFARRRGIPESVKGAVRGVV